MRIFLTGGTGFIGSHFTLHAQSMGHEIVALRRTPDSRPRIPLPLDPRWIEGGMNSVKESDFEGVSVLVHLAGAGITPQPTSWDECLEVNLVQSFSLVRRALRAGVARVVVAGTYAEYGRAGLRFDPIAPDAPVEPTDCYAVSKAAFFLAMDAFCRSEKFEFFHGRLFSVFGDGQFEGNLWPSLRRAALSGQDFLMTLGEQVRDFVPVADVAEMLLAACHREDLHRGVPKVENLASGNAQSLRAFAEQWWHKWNASGALRIGAIPYREGELMRYVPSVDRFLINHRQAP